MTVTTNFFQQPRLREAVTMRTSTDGIVVLQYRDEEYELELAPETRTDSVRLLDMLQRGGNSLEELSTRLPALSREVGRICRDLDRLGLLTETSTQPRKAKRGAQFYRELQRFMERAKRKYSARSFYQGLVDGSLGREQLIGYVLEYYHIVRMCPGLLAPALSHHDTRKTLSTLQDFFVSELHHDRLIERSLAAVGIGRKELDRLVPLPMTFTLCSSLGVYARQHPLSFKAALFLFEETSEEFHEAFKKRCVEVGLPEAFHKPILDHAFINKDGDHEEISEVLFAEVPSVSDEEQRIVMLHMGILVESLVIMDGQIVDYYGRPESRIPRVFD